MSTHRIRREGAVEAAFGRSAIQWEKQVGSFGKRDSGAAQLIVDLATSSIPKGRSQVLVIGAGAVGLVLSIALARKGIRVLLCESGGRSVERASQALNEAVIAGRDHVGITQGRARVLGGTTTLWGGQLISFREIDFRPRPWLGLPGWPIARSDLEKCYEAVADMLGLRTKGESDSAIWETLGIARPEFGPDFEFVLTRWLKEPNLARVFRKEIASNPNLTILLHAAAVGFVPAKDGRTIAAVELRSSAGDSITASADCVVIATGTIEANRLMLAAARARTELPWADNPHLGASFQDHLDLCVGDVTPIDKKRFSDTFDNIFINGFKYNPKIAIGSSIQERKAITNVAGSFLFQSSVSEHVGNVKIFLKALRNGSRPPDLRSLPTHVLALVRIWWPLIVRYIKDNRIFNPADLGIKLKVHCEQKPIARSRISLDVDRTDANGMPLAVLDWQVDGTELESIAVFCETLAPELERQGLASVAIDPRILARDPAMLDEALDTNHHCGGLRMAERPEDGVVDADLLVHGTANLYVAGAAVFPSSSFANPTFTAMALALRLAEKIESEL